MAAYQEYKNSGEGWLGEVPSHWDVKRLASYFSERKKKVSDKEYSPLSVTKLGIFPQWENVAKTSNGDDRKLVKKGDFVINSRSDRKGSSGISDYDGSVSLINIVLQPRQNLYGAYCNYLLKSHPFVEEFYRNGHGIVADLWTTRYDEMKLIKIPMPPLDEQIAITEYLNKRTSDIDEEIKHQQAKIDLLQERKRIIILNAVTKGLDESVAIKESGAKYIGTIPSHWDTCRLKNHLSLKGRIGWNGIRSEEFKEHAYAYLVTGQDFKSSTIDWRKCYQIDKPRYDEDPYIQLNNGDLLITKDGTIGKIAKVVGMDKPACLNSGIFVMKQKHAGYFTQNYLYWYLSSSVLKDYNLYTNTGTTIQHLYQNVFEQMTFLIPPIDEQNRISSYLDEKCSEIDKTIDQLQQLVDSLRERKQIIVTEAVTGKINVL